MKATVSFDDFWNMYQSTDCYKDQYTRAGAGRLFDYLESMEEDTGEEIECDIIAIACDYSEVTEEEYKASYGLDDDDLDDDEYIIERYTFNSQDYILYQCH